MIAKHSRGMDRMQDTTGMKFYTGIEIDEELDQGEKLITLTSFATLERAERELQDNYNDIVETLRNEEKTINVAEEESDLADIKTDDNSWHLEIQQQVVQE